MSYRIGFGIDFHRLEQGKALWLGGVQVHHTKGTVGFSDADVLLHAICDALLGALALGDIGFHFPNTDERFNGIDSKILLKETYALIHKKGYKVVNIDSTICLELPKIMPYAPAMAKTISDILELTTDDVSIKATTTERLGFAGREEGVFAFANALLTKA